MVKRTKIISSSTIICLIIIGLVVWSAYSANRNYKFTSDYVSILQHYEQREKEILTIGSETENNSVKQLLVEYSSQIDSDIYAMKRWEKNNGTIGEVAGQIVIALESAQDGFDNPEELVGYHNAARKALFDASLELVTDGPGYRLFLWPWQKDKLVERLNYTFSKEVVDQYRENTEEKLPYHIFAARMLIIALE